VEDLVVELLLVDVIALAELEVVGFETQPLEVIEPNVALFGFPVRHGSFPSLRLGTVRVPAPNPRSRAYP
jgi:hypothetical protein